MTYCFSAVDVNFPFFTCFFTLLFSDFCSMSFFYQNRPKHVKLTSEHPHNMCLCSYHGNFIEAVAALHKCVPTLPDYKSGFIQLFLCKESSMDCWFSTCDICTGITIEKLKEQIGNVPLNTNARWMVWRKSTISKRIEKHEENGTLADLLAHLTVLSGPFLRHSFIKRSQSDTFNLIDRPMASDSKFPCVGLLQIDFAENFVCEQQDEVQSAHWNQRQLTLFTTAFYFNDDFQSKVFVSDFMNHTKDSIVPFLYKLLTGFSRSMKVLRIWSDGPSSQFKNKFIATAIVMFEKLFNIKIYWNYFATSHGKGCIDGIGATTKMIVKKHIRSRDCVVNNSTDFVKAFNMTTSKIAIEEVSERDIDEINTNLNVTEMYSSAQNISQIASKHQIQVINDKIITHITSSQGYN